MEAFKSVFAAEANLNLPPKIDVSSTRWMEGEKMVLALSAESEAAAAAHSALQLHLLYGALAIRHRR